jgi:hypothetical protein
MVTMSRASGAGAYSHPAVVRSAPTWVCAGLAAAAAGLAFFAVAKRPGSLLPDVRGLVAAGGSAPG